MYCRNCGKQLPEGTRFCRYCGAEQGTAPAPAAARRPEEQYAPYTQPTPPAQDPQPVKGKGRAGVFIAIAAALAALLLGAFVIAPMLHGSGGGAEPDSAAPALEMGDDPLTFIFELEGEIYQLPAPFAVFADEGWKLKKLATWDEELPKQVQPGETCFASLYHGKARCDIMLKNFGESPAAPKSCHVIQVGATLNSGASITIPEGITLDMNWQELMAIVEPSETTYYSQEFSEWGSTELVAQLDPDAFLPADYVEILYEDEGDAVTGIWVHTETLH